MLPILTIKAEPFPIIMREFRHTESEKGADSVSDKIRFRYCIMRRHSELASIVRLFGFSGYMHIHIKSLVPEPLLRSQLHVHLRDMLPNPREYSSDLPDVIKNTSDSL